MISAGNKEDAHEMVTAVQYYQEHCVQIQQTMTAFPSLDGARIPTLTQTSAQLSVVPHRSRLEMSMELESQRLLE